MREQNPHLRRMAIRMMDQILTVILMDLNQPGRHHRLLDILDLSHIPTHTPPVKTMDIRMSHIHRPSLMRRLMEAAVDKDQAILVHCPFRFLHILHLHHLLHL